MNAKFVHALCEFPCDACGRPALVLALAPVGSDGRICGDAQKPLGGKGYQPLCQACQKATHNKEDAEHKRASKLRREQRKWAGRKSGGRP